MSSWHDVAAADLPEGTHSVQLPGGRGVVLVRRGQRWWALRDRCPHQGARLSVGTMSGRVLPCLPGDDITMSAGDPVLVCPWHGWEFDVVTGTCVTDGAQRVRAYDVRVEAGRVLVQAR